MAWRDYYEAPKETNSLVESKITEAEALASLPLAPVIMPPLEELVAPEVSTPAIEFVTESGVACRIEGSAMPPPKYSDGVRMCANVRKFLG
jgi:hypothetical protein